MWDAAKLRNKGVPCPDYVPSGEGVRLEILAARHVATCLEYQRRNVEAFAEYGRLFACKAMCAEPDGWRGRFGSWRAPAWRPRHLIHRQREKKV